jgi:hypothetical protein
MEPRVIAAAVRDIRTEPFSLPPLLENHRETQLRQTKTRSNSEKTKTLVPLVFLKVPNASPTESAAID